MLDDEVIEYSVLVKLSYDDGSTICVGKKEERW